MNEKQSLLITQMFEIRKLNKTCNYIDCQNQPTKEIVLHETDLITKERKAVVSLYLCLEHFNITTNDITDKLNDIANKRWVIGKKEYDIGVITH